MEKALNSFSLCPEIGKNRGEMAKILLIDDEKDFVEALKTRLESMGYEILTAYDGLEGFKKACKEKPDLIILDLIMPKRDGYRVCEMLKCDAKYKKIPIIMLTARGKDLDLERIVARELGADAYINKPFESRMLLLKIKKLLAQHFNK